MQWLCTGHNSTGTDSTAVESVAVESVAVEPVAAESVAVESVAIGLVAVELSVYHCFVIRCPPNVTFTAWVTQRLAKRYAYKSSATLIVPKNTGEHNFGERCVYSAFATTSSPNTTYTLLCRLCAFQ